MGCRTSFGVSDVVIARLEQEFPCADYKHFPYFQPHPRQKSQKDNNNDDNQSLAYKVKYLEFNIGITPSLHIS